MAAERKASAKEKDPLANAAINLAALREYARKELMGIVESIKGPKALILDETLSGPLVPIADMKALRAQQLEELFVLGPEQPRTQAGSLLYITRANPTYLKFITQHVLRNSKDKAQKKYYVCIVPRHTLLVDTIFKDSNVRGDIEVLEFSLDLIPLDHDVISMEIPLCYRDCYLAGDPSALFYVARALVRLQTMFGLIPNIQGKGQGADHVLQLMRKMRLELGQESFASSVPEIQHLILVDRNIDMVTPMLTQQTYEGLLDDIFVIRNGMVELDAEIFPKKEGVAAAKPGAEKKRKVKLNAHDLYTEIRDLHYQTYPTVFKQKLAQIRATQQRKDVAMSGEMSEMKVFVTEFTGAMQEKAAIEETYLPIAMEISKTAKSPAFTERVETERSCLGEPDGVEEYIEALIGKSEPLLSVLRILCLLSLTEGLKPKRYDFFRREIQQTYGFEALYTLNNLESVGLLRPGAKPTWPALKKAFGLFQADSDLRKPNIDDLSYTFAGYTPLSVRLIELAAQRNGWKGLDEVMNLIPGRTIEFTQDLPPAVQERMMLASKEARPKKPIALVYFLGGVTYSEISALRYLSEKESHPRDYIVAATHIVSGSRLVGELVEKFEKGLNPKSMPQ